METFNFSPSLEFLFLFFALVFINNDNKNEKKK